MLGHVKSGLFKLRVVREGCTSYFILGQVRKG